MAEKTDPVVDDQPNPMTWWLALLGAVGAMIYLANPTWGVFEFLPDNIPGVGNLDETLITGFLIACLARIGINVIPGLNRNRRRDTIVDPPQKKSPPDAAGK